MGKGGKRNGMLMRLTKAGSRLPCEASRQPARVFRFHVNVLANTALSSQNSALHPLGFESGHIMDGDDTYYETHLGENFQKRLTEYVWRKFLRLLA